MPRIARVGSSERRRQRQGEGKEREGEEEESGGDGERGTQDGGRVGTGRRTQRWDGRARAEGAAWTAQDLGLLSTEQDQRSIMATSHRITD
ncbi:hypothetical protein CC80DRAFT_102061 [Byssothecium circinans]|uniref:Uncharacterized protein n=1 Tax=Byssothecium circinans TaxID=147558 RepID=A0A6A5UJ81_9PLEO|nr:hypothetical protein CC80DRAFT_102061 [Byssothecium circinans]